MALIYSIPKEETYDLPEGRYRARLSHVRTFTKQSGSTTTAMIRLSFEVQIPSLKNKIPMAGRNFNLDLRRNSDLRGFLEGWKGEQLFAAPSNEINFEQLVGGEADIVLRHHHNYNHDRPYVQIESIHPAGTKRLTERPVVVSIEPAEKTEENDWREVA